MLVIALFVIIVFGLLGLTMTRLLSSSSQTVIYEVLGQRAINAARTGLECNLSAKYPISGATAYCVHSVSMNSLPGLENCSYSVTSDDVTVTDNDDTYIYSKFTSIGQCTAGDINVTRTVYVDVMVE